MQHTSKSMREKMSDRYEQEPNIRHKHNKNHMECREHEPSHERHIHGGKGKAHKMTHHHHKTTHHPHRDHSDREAQQEKPRVTERKDTVKRMRKALHP